MDDIYNKLNIYLKGNRKNSINEALARFMLLNLNDIPNLKVSDIAECCHTSSPSVIRFCRELGCEGYAQFKERVEDYLLYVQREFLVPRPVLCPLGTQREFVQSVETWTEAMKGYAAETMLTLNREQVVQLAQDIIRHKHVYVFGIGMSGLVADQLRIRLARKGKLISTMGPP